MKAQNLLSNFGGCIQKIELIHPWLLYHGRRVPKKQKKFKLRLVMKYCANLTHVTIHGFVINSTETEMWKSFFANICTLKLQDCRFGNVTLFFVLSLRPKLKYLKMYGVEEAHSDVEEADSDDSDTLMDTESMPTNSEKIKINNCNIQLIRHQKLIRLIESNRHLRKLS